MMFDKAKLKQRREELGLSQTELAQKIGTGHSNISGYENGKRVPHPYTRRKLAKALKCKPEDFVSKEEA